MLGVGLQIAVIVVLTLLNGLFAMSETALVSSRKARLRQRAEAGDRGARAALELAESPNRFLSTVQIGISLIGVLAGAFGGAALAGPLAEALRGVPWLAPYAGPLAFGTVVAAITYLSLIIGELVPKRLALNGAEAVAGRVAGPMRLLSAITSPAVWFLSASTEGVLRLLGVRQTDAPPVSEQEVEILMEEGARAGVFEEQERELVARALRLDDRPVRELMTPRPNVVWLDADDPPEEILRRARESRHSYFPVARGDLDDLLGLASIKDDWAWEAAGHPAGLLGALRKPALVSEGAPATRALEAFKGSGLPLAVVIDERGNIEGVVTLTDVLEALVGEVPDADEPAAETIVRREDGSWLVDGLLAAEELEDRLGLDESPRDEEKTDYQTVGGMVMDVLGRVPVAGDRFERKGHLFEVLRMDGRRVDKVLITSPARGRRRRRAVAGAARERCPGTPPNTEASCTVGQQMRESQRQTGVKYAQFSLVGITNMLVDVGVLNLLLLVGPTRSPELLVVYNVGALVLANANSYLWNTLWTFKDQARHDAKQVGMFTAQGLLNVAVGSALLWLAAHGMRAYTDLSPWLGGNAAKAISTVSASTVSFLFLRLFVFRPRKA